MFNHSKSSKSIFIKVENHHAGGTCMLAPLLFSMAPQCPRFFHSRIATVTPVSHPLTRLIHTSPSCWAIYRSFEIILEMGTVHWIELQVQCFIKIHCFKNIQSDMKYISKNTFEMVFF